MFKGQKVVVVMPAYNAEKTLMKTYREVMDQEIVDEVIVVDDASRDDTVAVAIGLPAVRVEVHENNKGYGANQKTCYRLALDAGADIVIMVHPDYQYTPKLIPAMAAMIGNGLVPLCDRVAYPREICLCGSTLPIVSSWCSGEAASRSGGDLALPRARSLGEGMWSCCHRLLPRGVEGKVRVPYKQMDFGGRFRNEEFDAVSLLFLWSGAEEKASQTLVPG